MDLIVWTSLNVIRLHNTAVSMQTVLTLLVALAVHANQDTLEMVQTVVT